MSRFENLLHRNRGDEGLPTPDKEKIGEEIDEIINRFAINKEYTHSHGIRMVFNKHRLRRRILDPKVPVPGKKPEIHYFYDFESLVTDPAKPIMRTGIIIKPEGIVYYESTMVGGTEQFNYPTGENLENKQRSIESLRRMPHFPGDLRPPQAKN